MFPAGSIPSIRFRQELLRTDPPASLAQLQRLSLKLPAGDLRNTDPSSRQTSLALACLANRIDVVEWLLDEDHEEAEISRDTLGETCLHVAAAHGGADIIELYLAHYPFVLDWVNSRGATPLHSAAMHGQVECAQVLLDAGADIDAPDLQGSTPLHYASAWGKLPVAKLLIEMGCHHGAVNNDGFTAAEWAYSFPVLRALEEYTRAHVEVSKRAQTRKHSKAVTRRDASPGRIKPHPSLSRRGSLDQEEETPNLGLGLGLVPLGAPSSRLTPRRSSVSASTSYAPTPLTTPPIEVQTPPLGVQPTTPNTTSPIPSLLRLSIGRMVRSPSSSSTQASGPPSPAAESIRKISMRDQDAIESFRIGQGGSIGLSSPAVPPPPPSMERLRSVSAGSGSTSSGPTSGAPPNPTVLPLSRSRSGSNLSTDSLIEARSNLASLATNQSAISISLPSPVDSIPPTPPSASSKPPPFPLPSRTMAPSPSLSTASIPEGLDHRKERRLSGMMGIDRNGRVRSGSTDSSATTGGGGPGRVARALGLGKRG